jgi:hypothetical protein
MIRPSTSFIPGVAAVANAMSGGARATLSTTSPTLATL